REQLQQAFGWQPADSAHAGPLPLPRTVRDMRMDSLFDGTRAQSPSAAAPVVPRAPPLHADPSLSGAALRDALRAQLARGQVTHDYDSAKSFLFSDADNVVHDGVRGVVDAYSGIFIPGTGGNGGRYSERGDQDGDGFPENDGMNVEHLWPQSFFDRHVPMRSDLHHLMATFEHPNGMRGTLPFGEVPPGKVEYHNAFGARMGGGLFEPPDISKGRVARAMLYFFVRYGAEGVLPRGRADSFWNSRIETLLRWNREFPPSEFERRRNDVVERFQGNRNPFVDDPGLADRIGAAALRADGGSAARAARETALSPETLRSSETSWQAPAPARKTKRERQLEKKARKQEKRARRRAEKERRRKGR
ncbi:MAG: endonuclease, partial [Elusimicrobia bacterium]|nr:endonuclease [Elusimicrobiota bacterium]